MLRSLENKMHHTCSTVLIVMSIPSKHVPFVDHAQNKRGACLSAEPKYIPEDLITNVRSVRYVLSVVSIMHGRFGIWLTMGTPSSRLSFLRRCCSRHADCAAGDMVSLRRLGAMLPQESDTAPPSEVENDL